MDYKVFGCKTNKYFAEKWLAHPHLDDKKGYFIASCVVTDRAKAKWVKHAIKKLKTLKDDEKLFLSGCGNIRDGVVDPKFYEIYHELENFREKIEILPEDPSDFVMSEDEKKRMVLTKLRTLKSAAKQLFTRKYVVVQTGCDNFCTFCLTVQARGRHKFCPLEEILDEIHTFVRAGGKEIVLTGINLGAWGAETSNNFKASQFLYLIRQILDQTDIERIRISSLGVEFFTDEIIELFKNPRIIAYVHLSIQSGSSKILKRMNRHYDGEKVRDTLEKLRSLKREDGVMLNIGADLILGFPGESDADFADTLALVNDFGITQLHAFPFSGHVDHYSVPAGSFPDQIPNHIAQARTKEILEDGQKQKKWLAEKTVNQKMKVLIEKISPDGKFFGSTENYLACNETNFIPEENQKIIRGAVVEGIYTGFLDMDAE